MYKGIKYIAAVFMSAVFMTSAYYLPAETFIVFAAGWIFLIPAAFIAYMVYGLNVYMKERKHRIMVSIKPTEAMKALVRREAELLREKETLYEKIKK